MGKLAKRCWTCIAALKVKPHILQYLMQQEAVQQDNGAAQTISKMIDQSFSSVRWSDTGVFPIEILLKELQV